MAKIYLLTALIMSMAISGCQVIHANQSKVNLILLSSQVQTLTRLNMQRD